MDCFLLVTWNFSICPISCAKTPTIASYDSENFINPEEIIILLFSVTNALGLSSNITIKEMFLFKLFTLAIESIISLKKIFVS